MKIAFYDLESSPSKVWTFPTYKAFIAPVQIIDPQRVLSWALKYKGSKAQYADERTGHKDMIKQLHTLLTEADCVVTYNGKSFDNKMLNTELAKYGLKPLPPTAQLDLYRIVKKHFRLPSYKLEYVAQFFGVGEKVKHHGFSLWKECLAGDEKAWKVMRRYNIQDALLLEALYDKLRPWITGHPSHSAMSESRCCPECGSTHLQSRGPRWTKVGKFQRFQCIPQGHWSSTRISETGTESRKNILVSI